MNVMISFRSHRPGILLILAIAWPLAASGAPQSQASPEVSGFLNVLKEASATLQDPTADQAQRERAIDSALQGFSEACQKKCEALEHSAEIARILQEFADRDIVKKELPGLRQWHPLLEAIQALPPAQMKPLALQESQLREMLRELDPGKLRNYAAVLHFLVSSQERIREKPRHSFSALQQAREWHATLRSLRKELH